MAVMEHIPDSVAVDTDGAVGGWGDEVGRELGAGDTGEVDLDGWMGG